MDSRSGPDRHETFVVRQDIEKNVGYYSPARPFPSSRSPFLEPPTPRAGATRTVHKKELVQDTGWWSRLSRGTTICCLSSFLEAFGIRGGNVQQAWREKFTLCLIIFLIMVFVAFFTVGMRSIMCVEINQGTPFFDSLDYIRPWRDQVMVRGYAYNFTDMRDVLKPFTDLTADWYNEDISGIFKSSLENCRGFVRDEDTFCTIPNKLPLSPPLQTGCVEQRILEKVTAATRLTFEWRDVLANNKPPHLLAIYNGHVLNLTRFFNEDQRTFFRNLPSLERLIPGRDLTLGMGQNTQTVQLMRCLSSRYTIGYLGTETVGCAAYNTLMVLALVTIVGLILVRFIMAFLFHWTIAPHLTRSTTVKLGRNDVGFMIPPSNQFFTSRQDGEGPLIQQQLARSLALPSDLYTICLVPCYSEDERGIRNTLDSIAATDYPDERKLLFVICDGLIQGEGNSKTTPDLVVGMVEQDPELDEPNPCSYLAIADGEKQTNMAKVYAGKYMYRNRPVPIVVVVKCGTEKEREATNPQELAKKKAGNRGKRDSQLILINFLSRVTFYDRMTQLDYELFWKIRHVTGATADLYELVLMVDADTIVDKDSLRYMVQTMVNDENIMGLCGETRIANKKESWVTMIQVYEYFTNHNLGKSFESVFGGVTCLPGCFCMYRINAKKGRDIVPLLVNPDIVEQYSENVVDTLHKKNLLLLGEDRFLTTLLLGNFPKRKMVFVPQALCHTTVPHTYKMLQSQRRRWINSTIHNLLELVLLPNLCGTFCFSMQFVIALELLGTVSLPAAILLTFYLIISSIASGTAATLPLTLLVITLILPGILVLLTTRKPVYALWMFVYLLALPIWNFSLPLYAFWHFDDFSWGDTRKVEGEVKGHDHSTRQGAYQIGSVQLKLWDEWESQRLLEQAQKPKREKPERRKRNSLPPPTEKEVPLSAPKRQVPPIPPQFTFREARKVFDNNRPDADIERPQTAFKINSTAGRRFSLQPKAKDKKSISRKMSLQPTLSMIDHSLVENPPTPIEKDSYLVNALEESVQKQPREGCQPSTTESNRAHLTESTLPIKPGNTINKFWKALYLGQQTDVSQITKYESAIHPTPTDHNVFTASIKNGDLLLLPKLDLSLGIESDFGVNVPQASKKGTQQENISLTRADEQQPQSSSSSTVTPIETPRVSQLQVEDATKSMIPDQKSFIVTPLDPLEDSFSSFSTPTQSFQTAPLENDLTGASMQSMRSIQGPRPLPLDMDQSLSRSMASLHSLSTNASIVESSKLVGPRPLPQDSKQILDQSVQESLMNQSLNRSVMGPRPLPRDSEEIMNQSLSRSIHKSVLPSFDDSMVSMDDSFNVSAIPSNQSPGRGPRHEPTDWNVELSFNLDENRTSTTNKKFKEMFQQLKGKISKT